MRVKLVCKSADARRETPVSTTTHIRHYLPNRTNAIRTVWQHWDQDPPNKIQQHDGEPTMVDRPSLAVAAQERHRALVERADLG